MFKSIGFAMGVICTGLVLLGLSYAWNFIVPRDAVWSQEQARENAQAAANLHQMTHVAGHSDISRSSDEDKRHVEAHLASAQKRFDESRAGLDRAVALREDSATALRWIGIGLSGFGILLYLAAQGSHDGSPRRPRRSEKKVATKR